MKKLLNQNYELARTILGNDFVSPEDVMNSCKEVTYTDEKLAHFHETIPEKKILEWCRDNNYMIVAGPNKQMSLLDIRNIKNDYFILDEVYANQKFAKSDKAETKWYKVRKSIVPRSTYKGWDEQCALISDKELFVPNSAELTWAIIIYKKVRGICLFGKVYARTSSFIDFYKIHVGVGEFDDKSGLHFGEDAYSQRYKNVGISVARK